MKSRKSKNRDIENRENKELSYNNLDFPTKFNFDIIEKRLINYNQIASRRVDQYVHERRMSLQINLTILLALAAIFSTFFNILDVVLKVVASIFFICYFLLSFVNMIYNLTAHKTKFEPRPIRTRIREYFKGAEVKKYWITPMFYRGNVSNDVYRLKSGLNDFAKKFGLKKSDDIENINKNDEIKKNLMKNEIKNLYILFKYQSNYYRLAKWTRRLTLYGIVLVGLAIFVIFLFIIF